VLEGTVDRIDYDRGIFDVRTRDRGTISVALLSMPRHPMLMLSPPTHRDSVRVEGEFINRDNFQVSSLSAR
jgi:hypothetical protein